MLHNEMARLPGAYWIILYINNRDVPLWNFFPCFTPTCNPYCTLPLGQSRSDTPKVYEISGVDEAVPPEGIVRCVRYKCEEKASGNVEAQPRP